MPSRPFALSIHLNRALAGAGLAALIAISVMGLGHAFRDRLGDFWCFYDGAKAARLGQDIYASGNGGYIYPPLLAWALQPLSLLPRQPASIIWELLMIVLIPTTAVLAAREFSRRFRFPSAPMASWGAAGLGVLIVADKLRRELTLGNCDLFIILATVLALRWLTRRPLLAGLTIGLAINIKYLPVVFLPYLIVRARFRALAGAVLGAVLFALLPAITFGWDNELAYLRVAFGGLLRLSGSADSAIPAVNVHPLAWEHSVSIPSTLARTGIEGAATIGTALAALAALAIAWAIYWANRTPILKGRWGAPEDSPERAGIVGVEWAMLSAGVLVFSPQTTPSHICMSLTLCILAGVLFLHAMPPARWAALGGIVAFLAALLLPPPWNQPLRAILDAWRSIAGMSLGLLALLYCVQWAGLRAAQEPVTARSAPG